LANGQRQVRCHLKLADIAQTTRDASEEVRGAAGFFAPVIGDGTVARADFTCANGTAFAASPYSREERQCDALDDWPWFPQLLLLSRSRRLRPDARP